MESPKTMCCCMTELSIYLVLPDNYTICLLSEDRQENNFVFFLLCKYFIIKTEIVYILITILCIYIYVGTRTLVS